MKHQEHIKRQEDLTDVSGKLMYNREPSNKLPVPGSQEQDLHNNLQLDQFFLSVLMDNVPDYIYFKDRDSRFVKISKSLAKAFGLIDPSQAVGKTDFDFFTEPHARQAFEDEQKIIETGQPFCKEEIETRTDRPDRWVLTTKMPLRDCEGNIIGSFGISRDITEQKHAEILKQENIEILNQNEEFKQLNDALFLANKEIEQSHLLLNETGKIAKVGGWRYDIATQKRQWTEELYHLFELDPSVNLDEINRSNLFAQHSKPVIEQATEQAIKFGEPFDLEVEVITAKGNHRWIRAIARPYFSNNKITGMIGATLDITERKQIEEALNKKTEELVNFFNVALDLLCIADISGKFVKVNKAWEIILGYTIKELEGRQFMDFVHPDDIQSTQNVMVTLNAQQPILNFINRYKCHDGSFRYIEWRSIPVGNLIYAAARDITERIKAEQQIKNQNQTLEDLVATKNKFFSIIAHDLKSPFNALVGLSGILIEDFNLLEKEDILKYITLINSSAIQTLKLLENLLEWSRIQRGLIVPDIQKTELSIIVDEVFQLFIETAKNKNITLEHNITPDVFIMCDVYMTNTILRNLISNAIKFSNNNGHISISAKQYDSFVEIQIKDEGIGIPPLKISHLFSVGHNISTSGTSNERGSGLGLILCKELIELQGGKIWVNSDEGKGSSFHFILPGG